MSCIVRHSRANLELDANSMMGNRLGNRPRAAAPLKNRALRASPPLDRTAAHKIPGMPWPSQLGTWVACNPERTGPHMCSMDIDPQSQNAALAAGAIGQSTILSRAYWAIKPKASSTRTVRLRRPLGAPRQRPAQTARIKLPLVLRRRPQGPVEEPIDEPSANADTRLGLTAEPAAPKYPPTGKALWLAVLVILLLPLVVPGLLQTRMVLFLPGGQASM